MKRNLLIASLFTALAAFAGTPKAGVETQIKAAEKALAEAMMKADGPALDKILADDIRYTHSDTRLEGKKGVLEGIQANAVTKVEYNDSTYRQYGDTVISSHKLGITTQKNGHLDIYVTMVWVKGKGGWQLANRQSTRYPAK